jgi:heme-degrading monooxygenase HmoA
MFTHIVLWKLKDSANGKSREENARLIKERFEEIANMLDGLRRMDVGLNVLPGDDAADVALYAEFESRAAFEAYYEHPAHKALVGFIKDVRVDRRVIDYET